MFWRKRKKTIKDDLKAVTEMAGDQIAPGVGTLALVIGGLAVGTAAAYFIAKSRKNKKTAR